MALLAIEPISLLELAPGGFIPQLLFVFATLVTAVMLLDHPVQPTEADVTTAASADPAAAPAAAADAVAR